MPEKNPPALDPRPALRPGPRPGFFARDRNFTRLLGLFVVLFVVCAALQPEMFLRRANFLSMAKQFPEFGLLAIGVGVAMLTGGIDLSVVNIANLSAVTAALIMKTCAPRGATPETTALVIAAAMAVSLAMGFPPSSRRWARGSSSWASRSSPRTDAP